MTEKDQKSKDLLATLAEMPIVRYVAGPLLKGRERRRAEAKAKHDKFDADGAALRRFGR